MRRLPCAVMPSVGEWNQQLSRRRQPAVYQRAVFDQNKHIRRQWRALKVCAFPQRLLDFLFSPRFRFQRPLPKNHKKETTRPPEDPMRGRSVHPEESTYGKRARLDTCLPSCRPNTPSACCACLDTCFRHKLPVLRTLALDSALAPKEILLPLPAQQHYLLCLLAGSSVYAPTSPRRIGHDDMRSSQVSTFSEQFPFAMLWRESETAANQPVEEWKSHEVCQE